MVVSKQHAWVAGVQKKVCGALETLSANNDQIKHCILSLDRSFKFPIVR